MKKFLTLALVLVLALGLTVPAMAFTSDTSETEDTPYDLKIYLVDYDDNDLFGLVALPESDRGYAKNEIVSAIVELVVPEDQNPDDDGYTELVFGGDNVDLDVTDNANGTLACAGFAAPKTTDTFAFHDDELVRYSVDFAKDDTTYKWLFFAKVTDDDASLYAKLIDGEGSDDFWGTEGSMHADITLEGVDYLIQQTAKGYTITVMAHSDDYNGDKIFIDVDDDNVSEGMSILIAGGHDHPGTYPLGVNTKNELGIILASSPAKITTDGDEYDAVMDVYNDIVVDVFGMDYFKIGNYVRDSYFEDLVSSDTIIATVDIEPWTAYVTVPDNIVVDPPKTGGAASIMGFVMVALAGSSVVALRKRG